MTARQIGLLADHASCLLIGTLIFWMTGTGELHWLWGFPAWGVAGTGWFGLKDMWQERPSPIDPRTGRPYGDHGTHADALEFARILTDDEIGVFIDSWADGDLSEWPEFYTWLKEQEE